MTAPETLVAEEENTTRHTVSFAVPLTSALPASSSAAQPSLFTTHHIPEDQASAAKEAIRQAGIMMEQVKAIRDASQAAYDASSALKAMYRSVGSLVLLGYAIKKLFFPESIAITHWVCRLKLRVSGGTLSAPTGCRPRNCGRLLAVDYSLKEYVWFFFGCSLRNT